MGSFGQRWTQSRPTKTFVFWSSVAVVIATVTIGFTWGGWVTSSTAQTTAKAMAEDAVVHRLTPICVAAAQHDPARDKKLEGAEGHQRVGAKGLRAEGGVGEGSPG